MLGTCPACQRNYDISDDFLQMGGKAKCPHCLEGLIFEGQQDEPRLDPREDQTRIDPNRERATTRVDPEEVDARCGSCDRRFKIDSQYLRMGGQAKCPHCGDGLLFDVPAQAPPPKPPSEEDLWSDTTGQTVEIGSQMAAQDEPQGEVWADDRFGSGISQALDDDADQAEGQQDDLAGEDVAEGELPEGDLDQFAQDPYSGTGEVSLPELEGLQAEAPDEGWAAQDGEQSFDAVDFDQGEVDEDEFDDALPTEVVASPFAGGDLSDEDMPTPDEGEEPGEDWADEAPEAADSAGGLADALDEELEGYDEPPADESLDGFASELGDALAEEAEGAVAADAGDGAEESQAPVAASEPPPEGSPPQPQVEGLDDDESEDDDSTKEVSADLAAELDAQAAAMDGAKAAPEPPVPGEVPEGADGEFENLASTDDWASAAAAWAESGFSTSEMPSFIKSEPPPDGEVGPDDAGSGLKAEDLPKVGEEGPVYRTTPSGQNLDELRTSSLPADAPADSVEVSDADIIMLDDGEVEELDDAAPATVPEENWAQRANRQVAAKPEAAKAAVAARPGQALLGRLSSPPVLAGALGVTALVIVSLMWVLLGSGEEVEAVAFPSEGLKAERVEAPAPRAYKAKGSAVKHYGLGNRQAHLGKFEEAILEYQKASRLDPGYPHPHRAMGSIYAAMGEQRLSIVAYRLYLQLEPEGPDAAQIRTILKR